MKKILFLFLITFSCSTMADWVEYSTMSNGDIVYFDSDRVEKIGNHINVWNRIRYKTSVMGASSYQSLLTIDCSQNSETIRQSTFFSDKEWTTPAMATNNKKKPEKPIKANSASERLAAILCKE